MGIVRCTKKKGNPSTMKEKKVPSKRNQNFALSQSKENSIDINEKVQIGVKLLAFLTSLVLHTSMASSSRLNL
jgi:hypothetical protein